MRFGLWVLLLPSLTVVPPAAVAQRVQAAEQIAGAVLAAPESMREGAEVLGYGGAAREGDVLSMLRAGSNQLICLADDPGRDGFHAACYHKSLDPFMVLGRRLREAGADRTAVMDARYRALEDGLFRMPDRAMLYSVSSDAAPDASSGRRDGERRLVVVYVPGATGEELGLPTRPEGDTPWLMLPGTPWAHIMIGR
jgi:hypothetical protein